MARAKGKPNSETPIGDQVEEDLKNAQEEDLTHFDEDDDPLTHAGEFVEDDTEEGSE
jgi:hypothetical protein